MMTISTVAPLFDELYGDHYELLCRYLRAALGDPDEAGALTNTVFTNAYAALRVGDWPTHPRAWLLTIARNELLKHVDKHGRVAITGVQELNRRLEGEGTVDPPAVGWLTQGSLIAHFDRLSPRERQVLTLAFPFDFDAQTIAGLLGTTARTVEVTKSRALRKLEARLSDDPSRNSC